MLKLSLKTLCLFVFGYLFVCCGAARLRGAKVLYEWAVVEYDFPNDTVRSQYVASGLFIPENNAITGVKRWKNEIFVTVPRWRPGVPSTLNKVVVKDGKPLLQPFPSWEAQKLDDPNALQYVQSMQIDSQGRMWIIDVGRRNFFSGNNDVVNGPAKFWLYDIDNNKLLLQYVFPNEVASNTTNFLNDLVIDEKRGVAYISEAADGSLVVLDINSQQSRRFSDNSTKVEPGNVVQIQGVRYPIISNPADGIAISPDRSTVYYCALSGFTLYSVPAHVLRNFTNTEAQISQAVRNLGQKVSQSDGIAMSNTGVLYFGVLGLNGVYSWDSTLYDTLTPENQTPVILNDETIQWVDTFAFSGKNSLLFTSNRLHLYFSRTMDFSGRSINFRIWRIRRRPL